MKKKSDIAEAYRLVALTEAGRIVLADLLGATGVWRDGYIADQHLANFRKGERNIGLRIMAQLGKADKKVLYAVLCNSHASQEKPSEEKKTDANTAE